MAEKNKAIVQSQSDQSVPVLEEEVDFNKRKVLKDRVRVEVRTETLEEVAAVAIQEDVVDIKRIAVELPVDKPPAVRTEGDVLIVPVLEEIVVVERRLVLKEELHIRRGRTSKEVNIPVTRRSQRVKIERAPSKK